jgi:hypothetical protein
VGCVARCGGCGFDSRSMRPFGGSGAQLGSIASRSAESGNSVGDGGAPRFAVEVARLEPERARSSTRSGTQLGAAESRSAKGCASPPTNRERRDEGASLVAVGLECFDPVLARELVDPHRGVRPRRSRLRAAVRSRAEQGQRASGVRPASARRVLRRSVRGSMPACCSPPWLAFSAESRRGGASFDRGRQDCVLAERVPSVGIDGLRTEGLVALHQEQSARSLQKAKPRGTSSRGSSETRVERHDEHEHEARISST